MKKWLGYLNPLRIFRLPKKIWIPGILIVLVLIWFVVIPSGPKEKPQFAQAKHENLRSTVSASGILTGKNTATLTFQSGGQLAYINVKKGDTVKSGQVLAGLDATQLAIDLRQAENTLRSAQATVDKTLDDTHLFQYGAGGTTGETQTQIMNRTTAQVARDNAFDSVKAAREALYDTTLISPIAGTVTQAPLLAGQTVSGGATVVQIVDWTGVYFDTDIDEADISKISVGQQAEVTLNAYPDQTFSGSVAEILPSTKTTTSGATVVTVRIALDNPGIKLIANLNGDASIILDQAPNALAIPQEAVTEDNKVVVQTANGLETRQVTTGLRSDTDVEILSGLNDGEQVVTNPVPFINQPPKNFWGR